LSFQLSIVFNQLSFAAFGEFEQEFLFMATVSDMPDKS